MGWLNLFYVCVFCILQCLSLHLFLTNTCWSLSCKVWQRTSRESRWQRRSWFQGKVRKSLRNWRWSPARSFLGISQILKNENTNFSKGFYVLSSEENYQRQLGFQSRDWQQRCPFRRHCIEGSPLNFKLKCSLHCVMAPLKMFITDSIHCPIKSTFVRDDRSSLLFSFSVGYLSLQGPGRPLVYSTSVAFP